MLTESFAAAVAEAEQIISAAPHISSLREVLQFNNLFRARRRRLIPGNVPRSSRAIVG